MLRVSVAPNSRIALANGIALASARTLNITALLRAWPTKPRGTPNVPIGGCNVATRRARAEYRKVPHRPINHLLTPLDPGRTLCGVAASKLPENHYAYGLLDQRWTDGDVDVCLTCAVLKAFVESATPCNDAAPCMLCSCEKCGPYVRNG